MTASLRDRRSSKPLVAAAVRRLAVLSALALTVFGVSVPAAFAGQSQTIDVDGGVASFNHNTDVLYVKDQRKDGWAVDATLWSKGGGKDLAERTDENGASGGGNSADLTGYYPQGTVMRLEICYDKPGETRRCSEDQMAVL